MGVLVISGNAWAINSPEYFPLTQGISWTYTTSTVTVSGTQDVNGVQTTVQLSSNGNKTFNTSDPTNGILLHGQFTLNVGGGISLTLTFDDPIVLATASPNPGTPVPSSGTAHVALSCGGTADLPYTATFTVTEPGDVIVPAGTFTNVVQLTGTIHNDAGQTTSCGVFGIIDIPAQDLSLSFSLALNIGTVKLISGETTVGLTASNILLPSVSPASWNYGNVEVGAGMPDKSFTVHNSGPATLNGSVTLDPPSGSDFSIQSGGGVFLLGPDTSVTVRFAPTSEGVKNATLRVSSSDFPGANPKDVPLSGTGATHALTITNPPSGIPNPVASGETANLNVAANDTLGHDLTYAWTADCPAALVGEGSFNNAALPNPTWTAPANTTGSQQNCTLQVTVSDGQGLSESPSYAQGISPEGGGGGPSEPTVPQLLNLKTFDGSGSEQQTFLPTDPIHAEATYFDPNAACAGVAPVLLQLLVFNLDGQLLVTREDVTSAPIAPGSKYRLLSANLAPGDLVPGAYTLVFLVRDCTNVNIFVSGFYPILVFTP